MATYIRAQVSLYKAGDLAADWITNTLHFKHTLEPLSTLDWESLAQDLATLMGTYRAIPGGYNRQTTKLYSLEDPLPRPVKAERTDTLAPSGGDTAPREVALCLSYYSERNLPRNRGRLFIGPWSSANERPSSGQIAQLTALKDLLADLGGVDVQWCVYSRTTPGGLDEKFKQVSAGWVDNEWDTVRSRGLKATARNAWTKEG